MKPPYTSLIAALFLPSAAFAEENTGVLVEIAEEVLSVPVGDGSPALSDEFLIEFRKLVAEQVGPTGPSAESWTAIANCFLGEANQKKGTRLGRDLVFAARWTEFMGLEEDAEGELGFVMDSLDVDAPQSFMEAYLLTEPLHNRAMRDDEMEQDLRRIRAAVSRALGIMDEQEPDNIDPMIEFFNGAYSEAYSDESVTVREVILAEEISVLGYLAKYDNSVIDEALIKIASFKATTQNPEFEDVLGMAERQIGRQLRKLNEQGN